MIRALDTLRTRLTQKKDALAACAADAKRYETLAKEAWCKVDQHVAFIGELEKAIRLLDAVDSQFVPRPDDETEGSPSLYKEVRDSVGDVVPSVGNEKAGFYPNGHAGDPIDRMNMAGGSGSTPNMVHSEVHVGTIGHGESHGGGIVKGMIVGGGGGAPGGKAYGHGGVGVGPFHEGPAGGGDPARSAGGGSSEN